MSKIIVSMNLLIELLLCAGVILIAANYLTKYADILAEKFNLSRSWVGVVLLAAITSLPELSNSLSAAVIIDKPDLGVGNLLGACLMNLLVIAFIDYLSKNKPIYNRLDLGHVLSAGFAILLLTLVCAGIFFSPRINAHLPALAILIVYLIGQRQIFLFEKGKVLFVEKIHDREKPFWVVVKFAFFGLLVIAAGIWLSRLGDNLAVQTGWGTTFVGSLILSIITTLPELTVSSAAMRLGAADMAVSNLLGSVLFNVAIITLVDIVYLRGPLLGAVSSLHIITALSAIVCLNLVIIGTIKPAKEKFYPGFSWPSLLISLIVIGSWYLLFNRS